MNLSLTKLIVGGCLVLSSCSNLFSQTEALPFSATATIWVDSLNQSSGLAQLNAGDFHSDPNFTLGSPAYTYWFKYQLRNPSDQALDLWLNAGVFDSLSLFQNTDNQVIITHRGLLCDYVPAIKNEFRSLYADKYGFAVQLAAHSETDLYLRIKNVVRFESDASEIKWMHHQEHQQQLAQSVIGFTIFNAAFFGVFLFFIFFSLIQYFQNGDKSYLFYAQYLGLSAFYFWWKFEKSNSFLNVIFTDNPAYYYYFESPLALLIYISYFLFIVHFLNAKKELPGFYHTLKTAVPVLLLVFVLNLLFALSYGLSGSWEVNYWMRYLLIPLSFFAIYQVFKKRHQLGFYILTGTSFLLIGGIVTSILSKTITQHYQGNWDIPLLPVQIGILAEILFFSTGLAYKSRLAVAERIAMQADLQQQAQETIQLRNNKKKLTQLYSNLSHEFRTPLTVISGALSQIKGHRQERQLISRNSKQLLQMINQILDLNKVEANCMEVNWKQGDVMLFINYLAEPFELLARQKQHSLEINCKPRHLIMDFDAEKLQCILSNLLTNAIKYTPRGGAIQLNAYQLNTEGGSQLCIDVVDTGPGIPADHRATIFDHYSQLPGTEGGTGLGLALAKELSQLLGGTIELDSIVEQGSTFSLKLPIHQLAVTSPALSPEATDGELNAAKTSFVAPMQLQKGRPTLLLVEDNEDVLQVLKAQLQHDYNIFTSTDGRQGLAEAKKVQPDLIISDVMMPEMDGYELCRQLKKHASTQHIPVILLTAKAQLKDKLTGLEADADAYLCKPPSTTELQLRIRQLLKKQDKLREQSRKIYQQADLVPEMEQEAVRFMDKFHHILDNNLQKESFRVSDICLLMGTNHVTLNNRIKQYTTQTTASYIRNYRMQFARELLQTTELTVAEVAYRVGITEASNFGNMFKKAFGVSPGEWKMEGLAAEV